MLTEICDLCVKQIRKTCKHFIKIANTYELRMHSHRYDLPVELVYKDHRQNVVFIHRWFYTCRFYNMKSILMGTCKM